MADPKNLGRGLSDLMQEVSTVKAVHTPPPAAVPAAVEPPAPVAAPAPVVANTTEPVAAPAVVEKPATATVVVEERASDSVINSRQPVMAPPEPRKEIIREAVVPSWAWAAIAAGVLAAAAFAFAMLRAQEATNAAKADAKEARALLAADPLDWTTNLTAPGVRVERTGHAAVLVFEQPLFAGDTVWAPGADVLLRDSLRRLAPHRDNIQLILTGHTGSRPLPAGGRWSSNFELGLRRAETVYAAFVRAGWPAGAISYRSEGDAHPPFPAADPLSQARNRTVTLTILTR